MIYALLHNDSIWLSALVVLSFFAAAALISVRICRAVPADIRQCHNEIISYGLATISIFTAILLASIAVSTWETYNKATDYANKESQLISDVMRSTLIMPEPLRSKVLNSASDYLDTVIQDEWPLMANGKPDFKKGWDDLARMASTIGKFRSTDGIVQINYANLSGKLSDLIDTRRDRIQGFKSHLQPLVWATLITASLINIIFFCLFSMESKIFQDVISIMISIVIGFVFVLIISFDRPFEGGMAIKSDHFESVKTNFHRYKDMYQ